MSGRRSEDVSTQDLVNTRVYRSPRVVRTYANSTLRVAESAFLDRYGSVVTGRRTLELGCGAGRFTAYIADLNCEVVGIDLSPAMIEHCKRLLPSGTFVVGDLRELASQPDGSFGFVAAIANVLDAISHEDRLSVLADVHRMLEPDGLFLLASHNRNWRDALTDARRGPRLRVTRSPYRQLRALVGFARGQVNHRRFAKYQRFEPDYAILNDEAHGWRLLHYYIDRAAQVRQLAAAGFETTEVIAMDGSVLGADADDSDCFELHYVARRR